MLKKTIKYTDFNGNERVRDFYFNLNEAEVFEMNISPKGGLEEYIKRIVDTNDASSLTKLFKDLILTSYGERSLDGERFEKSEELSKAFSQTNAYPILYMELLTNPDKASEFVNGLVSGINVSKLESK